MSKQVPFEIKQEFVELSRTATTRKVLSLVSWNGAPEKLDLRTWREDEDGSLLPGRGVTLTGQEAASLSAALNLIQEQSRQARQQ